MAILKARENSSDAFTPVATMGVGNASQSQRGLMTAQDKVKVDSIGSAPSGETDTLWDKVDALDNKINDINLQTIGNLKIRHINHVVTINGYISGSFSTTEKLVGTLASNIPKPNEAIRCLCNLGSNAYSPNEIGYFVITTDGKINVTAKSGTPNTMYVSCSYITTNTPPSSLSAPRMMMSSPMETMETLEQDTEELEIN